MSIQKPEIISEGDCPFCGMTYVFNDEDRTKGENLCTACGKSYKLEKSKNIILGNNSVPVVQAVIPKKKTSWIAAIIMIPLTIFIFWFVWYPLSDYIEKSSETDPNAIPVLSPIDQCYSNAYDNMMEEWVDYCKVNNINIYKNDKGKDTCNIPSSSLTFVERSNIDYLADKALCIARYK